MMFTTWQVTRRMLAVAAVALLLALPAIAQTVPVIKVDRLKGAVEVYHADDTGARWTTANVGQELGAGWRLRTGAGAKVQLVFPRDNVVILKENSVLYVDKLDQGGGAELEADSGSLLVDLKNALAPGSEFELETPTALAVVRGTRYGAEDITDDNVTFYGYSGRVEIFDASMLYEPSILTAGYAVDVPFAEPPSQPYPSGQAAEDFAGDAKDAEEFDEADQAYAPLQARLGHLLLNLEDHEDLLGDYEGEWDRYEHNDQTGHLLVLYARALALADQVNLTAADFGYLTTSDGVLEGLLGAELLALDPARADLDAEAFRLRADAYNDFHEELADRFAGAEGPLGIGALLEEITALFADIYSRLHDFVEDAEPYIGDNEDILEDLRGLPESGDPVFDIRWRTSDTDGDGVSDVDELNLGSDPLENNECEGFIELIAPDDGESYEYPETASVTFEFEPLESSLVVGYDLLIEAGGEQWLRRDISPAEDVDLRLLVGDGGPFADALAADGEVTLSWLVAGILDESSLITHISARSMAQAASGTNVTSATRELTITYPSTGAAPEASLEALGTTLVDIGEGFSVRAMMTGAENLAEWEFAIVYDPSVVTFESGRRLGLFGNTTLFFGDHQNGVLTVSGSVPRTGDGISGDGDLFELEFSGADSGTTTIELDEVILTDILGNKVIVEIGTGVDIDVY